MSDERHTMIMVDKEPGFDEWLGFEEWFCPTCGRRFLMSWPPEFKRVILEPGNESVIHVGGKGDMGLGMDCDVSIEQDEPTSTPPEHFNNRCIPVERRPWFDNEWEGNEP